MNAILGFCRVLLRDPLAPSQTEKLQYIHDAAECLLQHINNALNLSRLAAGELKLSQAPFEFDSVVRDVMIAIRELARHKGSGDRLYRRKRRAASADRRRAVAGTGPWQSAEQLAEIHGAR